MAALIARSTGVLLVVVCAAVLHLDPPAMASTVIDADADGCSDGEEIGPNEALGGRRDRHWFWDFFDVPAGSGPSRDMTVSGIDFFALLARFGASGPIVDPLSIPPPPPAYHSAYDRGPLVGPDAWDLGAANGSIAGTDFFAMLGQFGHICTAPEALGSWSIGAPMPTARTEVAAATIGDVIYVIGGFPVSGGHIATVEAYDVSDNEWSTKAPLPQAIDHAQAAAVNGKLYLLGGYINLFSGTISTATYEYDPVGNHWTARAPMPLGRAAGAAVAVDGIIYVLGGVGPQATVPLAHNPTLNTWSQLAPMSAAREHLTASVDDGLIYVIGGRQNVTENVPTAEVYDPVGNDWQAIESLPTARGGLASGPLQGRIHVVGGENLAPGGTTFPQHEVYDPGTGGWMPAPPLPTPRHGLAGQLVGGRLFVIGGGPTPGFSVSSAVEIFDLKP